MANILSYLPMLFQWEGGWVNGPTDHGGATNLGVTFVTFKDCAKRLLKVEPTLENLRCLTKAQAGVIYKALYWDAVCGDEIIDQNVANTVFDFAVNAGCGAAGKMLQSTANQLGATLVVDGGVGNKTLAAVNALPAAEVYRTFHANRVAFYKGIVVRKPDQAKFLKGWLRRTDSLQ